MNRIQFYDIPKDSEIVKLKEFYQYEANTEPYAFRVLEF